MKDVWSLGSGGWLRHKNIGPLIQIFLARACVCVRCVCVCACVHVFFSFFFISNRFKQPVLRFSNVK